MKQEIVESDAVESTKVNIRTFKASAEVGNLYRFIGEFGLRKEAKMIFDYIVRQAKKAAKKQGKKLAKN